MRFSLWDICLYLLTSFSRQLICAPRDWATSRSRTLPIGLQEMFGCCSLLPKRGKERSQREENTGRESVGRIPETRPVTV